MIGAIKKYFWKENYLPETECSRLRAAIESICAHSHSNGPPPYKVGLFEIIEMFGNYEGDSFTDYSITYRGTLLWMGTDYGTFEGREVTPFQGKWFIEGPWQDTALAVLEARAATLKAQAREAAEERARREQEDYEAEVRDAEIHRRQLVEAFNNEQ